ncbi:MAG: transporter [Methylovirgula sp.]|uniref:transporter n=1 Tax=Methylovirgula sp. TaxID=1978224 RepID=UPI0030762B7C
MKRSTIRLARASAASAAALFYICGVRAFADPVSPAGWTMNLPVAVPLPGGLYFADTGYYMERQTAGAGKVQGEVNLPALIWSTPFDFLGGHVEAIATVPELSIGDHTAGISSTSFYNSALLIGDVWNLGSGWSVSEYVGTFFPVNTYNGETLGIGGNFWTFTDIAGIAYNGADGWSLGANLTFGLSSNDPAYGFQTQPDTLDVDFSAIKHIDKWELGFIGNASGDVSHAYRNGWGAHPYSQVALGGLVGYTFGTVTTEVMATRSVEARDQAPYLGNASPGLGQYDTRVWGRIIIPLWNPPAAPAPVVAKY